MEELFSSLLKVSYSIYSYGNGVTVRGGDLKIFLLCQSPLNNIN